MWLKLVTILWKNLVIRKRHWVLTISEIVIPIILFTLVAYGRSKISGMSKVHIKEPTYYDVTDTRNIYSHLDLYELKLWYAPSTNFTREIIYKIQDKLQMRRDSNKLSRNTKTLNLKHVML